MTTWLHYVRHIDVPFYLAAGWLIENAVGAVMAVEIVLMRWQGAGDPPEPTRPEVMQ